MQGTSDHGASTKNEEQKASFKAFLIETGIYAVLVTVYYFIVLQFLGAWVFDLFHHSRTEYAFVALGLIVGQGFVLELLTRFLLSLIGPRLEGEKVEE